MYHGDADLSTLADLSMIVDSPMMRVMSGEVVDVDTHTGLIAIAAYEDGLGLSALRFPGHDGRSSATRNSESSVNGRTSHADNSRSVTNPACAASSRNCVNS